MSGLSSLLGAPTLGRNQGSSGGSSLTGGLIPVGAPVRSAPVGGSSDFDKLLNIIDEETGDGKKKEKKAKKTDSKKSKDKDKKEKKSNKDKKKGSSTSSHKKSTKSDDEVAISSDDFDDAEIEIDEPPAAAATSAAAAEPASQARPMLTRCDFAARFSHRGERCSDLGSGLQEPLDASFSKRRPSLAEAERRRKVSGELCARAGGAVSTRTSLTWFAQVLGFFRDDGPVGGGGDADLSDILGLGIAKPALARQPSR
eukprot:2741426-Rhodomonas_salina.2